MKRRHVSKVFLDSRYALSDGKTFLIPGEALLLEPDSRCWLGAFTCVASWDTLDSTNNTFVVNEQGSERTIVLPTGPHDLESLRQAIEDGLNLAPAAGMGTYTAARVSTGTGGTTFRALRVSVSAGSFAIDPAKNNLGSICNFSSGNVQAAVHTSSFCDVRRVHSVYVHSDFGHYNCISPTGTRSVLAKIPVAVPYGGLVQQTLSGSEHDFVETGCHALTCITLSLHDAAGTQLDLKGTSWSCTLVFER